MEIKYVRRLNVSHMLIEQTGQDAKWEREMLANNYIKELMIPDSMAEDTKTNLWYDITGKQALDIVLESEEVGEELLRNICEGIISVAEKLQNLLLEPNVLLLIPECIFLDNQSGCLGFCYYPGNEQEFGAAFHKLLEYLLNKLDHKDVGAVEIAYSLYEKTKTAGYCIAEVRAMLWHSCLKEETVQEIFEAEIEEPIALEPEKQRYPVFIDKILKQCRQWAEKYIPTKFWKKKAVSVEPFVFEPEPIEVEKVSHPTVLLTEIANRTVGILKYEGEEGCPDLKIESTPFIIGSDKGVNGFIPSDTVSRRHAKITKKEDIYFIEDLNSSNGTYVGGELLNCRVKMSMQANEVIVFANEKFRFI